MAIYGWEAYVRGKYTWARTLAENVGAKVGV